MKRRKIVTRNSFALLAACLFGMPAVVSATTDLNYESPPILMAQDVLSVGLLRSDTHRVLDAIQYDGYFFRFELETEDSTDPVISKALLKIRVHEAEAIAAASNAMLRQTEMLASGTATQSADRGYTSAGTSRARDELDDGVPFSQIRLSGKKPTSPDSRAKANSRGVTDSISATGGGLSLEAHKRAVAARLQLDVYTSNIVAQDLLDQLARARVAGKPPLGASFFIDRDPETELARGLVDAEVRQALKNNTADDLREMNDRILAALAVPADVRQRFLDHPAFTPRHRTYITAYLEQLAKLENRELFLLTALTAENETQALFFEQMIRMLAVYNDQVERLASLSLAGQTVIAHTSAGTQVVARPVDLVYWSAYFDSLSRSVDSLAGTSAIPVRELVVTGVITDRARRELQQRDFVVRDKFLATH